MKRLVIALGISIATLVGCASGPTPEEEKNANYGPPPTQRQLLAGVERYKEMLLDPFSAHVRSTPENAKSEKLFKYWAIDKKGVTHFGWRWDFLLNAKNRSGGYTGWTRIRLFFENGTATAWADQYPGDGGMSPMLFFNR